jgi:hypothetical protein
MGREARNRIQIGIVPILMNILLELPLSGDIIIFVDEIYKSYQ